MQYQRIAAPTIRSFDSCTQHSAAQLYQRLLTQFGTNFWHLYLGSQVTYWRLTLHTLHLLN